MVSSLRHTVFNNFGKIDYLHYFRRMIKDYESRKWDFDVRTVVKNIKVEIPCPKYICKRGFSKRLCLTILDDNLFIKEFDRYLNDYIRPIQELRKNRILARRIFVAKYGYFTKYNKDCSLVNYDCGVYRFPLEEACQIATKTVQEFVSQNNCLEKVIFIDINDAIIEIYKRVLT